MSDIFGPVYADVYDLLYQDKDHQTECDVLEQMFQVYSTEPVERILDLGCGTGNHALLLAQRGYKVVGIDRAEAMLALARQKARQYRLSPRQLTFTQGDICDLDAGQRFDAVLMMFAVLGYQLENRDVLRVLQTAHRHLKPGGMLIFDVWYGPAVLYQRPQQRIKVIPALGGKILRVASGELDIASHITTVSYYLWQLEGDRLLNETTEVHAVRFFFPRELDLFLEVSGFRQLRLGMFPHFEYEPNESTWNAVCVAQAV